MDIRCWSNCSFVHKYLFCEAIRRLSWLVRRWRRCRSRSPPAPGSPNRSRKPSTTASTTATPPNSTLPETLISQSPHSKTNGNPNNTALSTFGALQPNPSSFVSTSSTTIFRPSRRTKDSMNSPMSPLPGSAPLCLLATAGPKGWGLERTPRRMLRSCSSSVETPDTD